MNGSESTSTVRLEQLIEDPSLCEDALHRDLAIKCDADVLIAIYIPMDGVLEFACPQCRRTGLIFYASVSCSECGVSLTSRDFPMFYPGLCTRCAHAHETWDL